MLIVSQRLQQDIIIFTLQHWTFNKSASNTSFQHYDLLRQLFSGGVFCIKFRFEPTVRRLAPPPAFLHVFLSPLWNQNEIVRHMRSSGLVFSEVICPWYAAQQSLGLFCGSAVLASLKSSFCGCPVSKQWGIVVPDIVQIDSFRSQNREKSSFCSLWGKTLECKAW